MRNASYSSAGELSPLLNDPECRTIGLGTHIFLCGTDGYVTWNGTQFNTSKAVNEHGIPTSNARTIAVVGDLKNMNTQYLRGAYIEKYGITLYVGIGIPIPILDEDLAKRVSIRNEQTKRLSSIMGMAIKSWEKRIMPLYKVVLSKSMAIK